MKGAFALSPHKSFKFLQACNQINIVSSRIISYRQKLSKTGAFCALSCSVGCMVPPPMVVQLP